MTAPQESPSRQIRPAIQTLRAGSRRERYPHECRKYDSQQIADIIKELGPSLNPPRPTSSRAKPPIDCDLRSNTTAKAEIRVKNASDARIADDLVETIEFNTQNDDLFCGPDLPTQDIRVENPPETRPRVAPSDA